MASDHSEGKAILFFGETPADRTYKLPASIKAAKVMAGDKEVEVEAVESDDLIGLVSKESVGESSLNSQVTFGIYHGPSWIITCSIKPVHCQRLSRKPATNRSCMHQLLMPMKGQRVCCL